ncbi:MAG: hypothetical protein AAFV53_41085, partial [Myxococcota bacterium]
RGVDEVLFERQGSRVRVMYLMDGAQLEVLSMRAFQFREIIDCIQKTCRFVDGQHPRGRHGSHRVGVGNNRLAVLHTCVDEDQIWIRLVGCRPGEE